MISWNKTQRMGSTWSYSTISETKHKAQVVSGLVQLVANNLLEQNTQLRQYLALFSQ